MSILADHDDEASLLNAVNDVNLLNPSENSFGLEDDDVFQCGKCKQNFTSLLEFLTHKKEVCVKRNTKRGKSICNINDGKEIHPSFESSNSPPSSPVRLLTDSNSLLSPNNMIHIGDNVSDYLSISASLESPQKSFNLCDNLLNSDSLSLLTASPPLSNACELVGLNGSSFSPTSSNLSFSTSFLTGHSSLLPSSSGSLLTSTTPTISSVIDGSSEDIDLSTITLTPTILLNITSPDLCNAQETPGLTTTITKPICSISTLNNDVLLTSESCPSSTKSICKDEILSKKNTDAGINILPHGEFKLMAKSDETQTAIDSLILESTKEENKQIIKSDIDPQNNSGLSDGKKQAKLKCNYCDRVSSKNFDLQQHIRCHTGEKPFQCIVCGRAFAQKSNVKKHMQTHKVWPDGLANTLPLLASSTGGSRSSSDDISEPGLSNPSDSEVLADPSSFERLIADLKETQGTIDSSYACPYCTFTGRTYFELKSHMKTHKREKVYKCIQTSCGKMFAELEPFLEHIQSHENEMTYSCHQCNKTFNSLCELGDHQYSHSISPNQETRSGQRYFRCSKCLNKYTTSAALEHHVATSTHHYPCPHCEKVFPCERYLRRHLLTHGSGLHMCQFCDKTFKTANYLKVHLVIHTGEKPYACNICNAAFNRRDRLKRHKLVHDPVKRFKCPLRAHTGCMKEFNRHDKLKAHMLTHCGIKPHECTQCGRAFSRRAHLRAHMTAHNKEEKTAS